MRLIHGLFISFNEIKLNVCKQSQFKNEISLIIFIPMNGKMFYMRGFMMWGLIKNATFDNVSEIQDFVWFD